MRRSTLGVVGICLVAALVILIVTLPVSGGRSSGPQDGTGNQYGGQMVQNGSGQGYQQMGVGNSNCINENCPNNGTGPRDGTGQKLGQSASGGNNGGQSGHHGQGSAQGCSHQSRG